MTNQDGFGVSDSASLRLNTSRRVPLRDEQEGSCPKCQHVEKFNDVESSGERLRYCKKHLRELHAEIEEMRQFKDAFQEQDRRAVAEVVRLRAELDHWQQGHYASPEQMSASLLAKRDEAWRERIKTALYNKIDNTMAAVDVVEQLEEELLGEHSGGEVSKHSSAPATTGEVGYTSQAVASPPGSNPCVICGSDAMTLKDIGAMKGKIFGRIPWSKVADMWYDMGYKETDGVCEECVLK